MPKSTQASPRRNVVVWQATNPILEGPAEPLGPKTLSGRQRYAGRPVPGDGCRTVDHARNDCRKVSTASSRALASSSVIAFFSPSSLRMSGFSVSRKR